jgi:hypothetical protein
VAEHELFAVVPRADGTAVVAVDGRLPRVTLDSETRTPAKALPLFERDYRIASPFLRIAKLIEERDPMLWLLEFDAVAADDEHEWLPLEHVREVAPEELRAAVDAWLTEHLGARPAQRAPWARPGWRSEADAWIRSVLPDAGRIAVERQWPLSSVLRVESPDGTAYFKASFSLFRHEAAVTEVLMPYVLAADRDRGWMLMRELPGAGEPLGRSLWPEAFRTLARVHLTWSGREDELLALGAQDRRLHALGTELPGVIDDASALRELERRLAALADLAIPMTLVHGDFHRWNVVQVSDGLVIYDWSDACVSHPFFDFATFFEFHGGDDPASLLDAYAEIGPQLDERAWSVAYPLACVHHSISYARIEAALAPDERDLFEDAPRQWIERALGAL